MKKIKPCDCKDEVTQKQLSEQGISINDKHLYLDCGKITYKTPGFQCTIPMKLMQAFAEWYLESQELNQER